MRASSEEAGFTGPATGATPPALGATRRASGATRRASGAEARGGAQDPDCLLRADDGGHFLGAFAGILGEVAGLVLAHLLDDDLSLHDDRLARGVGGNEAGVGVDRAGELDEDRLLPAGGIGDAQPAPLLGADLGD